MTEAILDQMLRRGLLRLRLVAAVRGACMGLGAGLALGAVLVVCARLNPSVCGSLLMLLPWIPPTLLLGAAALAFRNAKPSIATVAMQLDRSAKLEDHLTTWDDLRRRDAARDEWALAFVEAQRKATLRRAEGLDPARHLPVRLPEWARALLLGILALGCALLMPEQAPSRHATDASALEHEAKAAQQGGGGENAKPLNPLNNETPFRVQPLTNTEMLQARMATPVEVPKELKEKWLDTIEKKRGSLAENELTDDVREIRDLLRRQLGKDKEDAAKNPNGSQQAEGAGNKEPAKKEGPRYTQALPPAGKAEDLVRVTEDRFPDVAAAMERYYRAEAGKTAQP
ncbi:MAG: hypothetical protein HY291_22700 [Planctomycetes bacterium]|nr:hypothetical protein [Planctomycetota bacterium]